MILATAGHIDHGKTALVRALTGVDADRLPEEKKRGLTIDLGFAYTSLPDGTELGFVDVPGHERFLPNMLAGVLSIDRVLLIVAADDGPRPQTLEHLDILELIGIAEVTGVITKIDRVPAERLAAVETEVAALLAAAGYDDSPIFAVSSITGEGIAALSEHLSQTARAVDRARAARPAPVRDGLPVHFHLGAEDVVGRAAVLGARSIAPGERGFVQVDLEHPIGALGGDRVLLRDHGARHTLAGGRALDPFPPRRGRSRPERLAALAAAAESDAGEALEGLLATGGIVGLTRCGLMRDLPPPA